MATPFQILRNKALKLTFIQSEFSLEELFDISQWICTFIQTAKLNCFNIDSQIEWICSISNFEEDFFQLIDLHPNSFVNLNKRQKAIELIVEAFETMECSRIKFNKIKNLKFKNKKEGYYFKEMIKGFKPSTPFEKACVYLIQKQKSSFTKRHFESIGFDTSFLENISTGEKDINLNIGRINIPFCLTKYDSCGESLFLPLMVTQGGDVLNNH